MHHLVCLVCADIVAQVTTKRQIPKRRRSHFRFGVTLFSSLSENDQRVYEGFFFLQEANVVFKPRKIIEAESVPGLTSSRRAISDPMFPKMVRFFVLVEAKPV